MTNILNHIEVWGINTLTLFVALFVNVLTNKHIYDNIFSNKKDIIKHIIKIIFISFIISFCYSSFLLINNKNYYNSIWISISFILSIYTTLEVLFTDSKTKLANKWLLRLNIFILFIINAFIYLNKEWIILIFVGIIVLLLALKYEDVGMSDWRSIYISYLLFSMVNIYYSILFLALILLAIDVVRKKFKIETICGVILFPSVITTYLYYIIINYFI